MLFNSYEYIFLFLPLVFLIYFELLRFRLVLSAKIVLISASLFFYAYWEIAYLPILLMSLFVNYAFGIILGKDNKTALSKKMVLIGGVSFNLLLLGYFKYVDFFLGSVNWALGVDIPLANVLLPLAISFFTFQQIAYLVDSYKGYTQEYDFVNYSVFVTFFPQLIAGPIVHHKEMIPQFANKRNWVKNYHNIGLGLFIFSIGLFKKVMIADTLGNWADYGFDDAFSLTFWEAWATSLAYTFQLYFDFSGYTDMAIGAALLFNIRLPFNFNSPYKAHSIQDFWRRWHITLSRFLRDYIYIPLGGNRCSEYRTHINLMITFLLGGIWHGAGWLFLFWGFLHGFAMIVHRIWQKLHIKMPRLLAWFITFNFINITWVFFRAESWFDAVKVLEGMIRFNMFLPQNTILGENIYIVLSTMAAAFLLSIGFKNTNEFLKNKIRLNLRYSVAISVLVLISLLQLTQNETFLYFNF